MVATATLYLLPTDVLTNTVLGGSLTANTGAIIDAVTPTGSDGPIKPTHDDDTTYVVSGSPAREVDFGCGLDDTFSEKMATIVNLSVSSWFRAGSTPESSSCRLDIKLDGTTSEGTLFTPTTSWAEYTTTIGQNGGADWVEADLRHSTFEFKFVTDKPGLGLGAEFRLSSLWLKVNYIPLNRSIDLEREVASRRLRLNREPEEVVKIYNGWEALEAELMDPVGFSHAHGPTHDAGGWGVKDWQRGFGRLKKQTIDLARPSIVSTIGNRRRYQCTFWETMKLVVSGDPDIAEGMARLDCAGADREFSRASIAWGEDAGGVIKALSASKEKIEPSGTLIEEARTNTVLESSFVNGTTGWTKVENTGTADFATDAADLLFETGVSASVTATASTHDVEITDVTGSLSATTEYTLSLDAHVSLASGTIKVFLHNDTTGNWLTASNTWQGTRGAAPISFSPTTPARNQFTFDTESTASTHTIVLNASGTVNGTVYHFYHAQNEAGAWASSRIVCSGTAVTRALDSLLIKNGSDLAQRIWPVDKFTAKIKFTPLWSSAAPGATMTILELFHDASNGIRIEHTTATALRFVYEHGGTTETASFSSPGFVAGTEVEIVIRKGSTSGELDEANNTMSIFLDGVKGGTTDTAASDLTQAAASVLQIGALNDDTQIANGWFGEIMVSPIVFSDTEIAGGLS